MGQGAAWSAAGSIQRQRAADSPTQGANCDLQAGRSARPLASVSQRQTQGQTPPVSVY